MDQCPSPNSPTSSHEPHGVRQPDCSGTCQNADFAESECPDATQLASGKVGTERTCQAAEGEQRDDNTELRVLPSQLGQPIIKRSYREIETSQEPEPRRRISAVGRAGHDILNAVEDRDVESV